MQGGQLWRQYIIAGIASLGLFSSGYSLGWTAPINIKLRNETESPLGRPATLDELAWLGSIVNFGSSFGPYIGGFAASTIGRKWGLIIPVIPLLVGWIMIALANNMALLYAARVVWGLAIGIFLTISPMYNAEIATDDCRGALCSFLQLFVFSGFLMVYCVGPYVSYHMVAYIGIALVVLFAVTFFFMPDTPTYYLLKDDKERAAKSLSMLRGRSRAEVQAELNIIASNVAASKEKTATIRDVFRGSNFKAFYLCCGLVFFNQFSGVNAVLSYLTEIFQASGTDLDPAIATIIVGSTQVAASLMTPIVVDRLGRRILLLISSCGTATGLGLLGMFFLLDSNNSPVVSSISFLPVLSLVLYIVTFCWGLGSLLWAMMGELLPIEVKVIAAPIATSFSSILTLLITYFFPVISDAIGMHISFFVFAACCVVAFFFILFLVPETKGKSFQEIQEILGSGKEHFSEKKNTIELKL